MSTDLPRPNGSATSETHSHSTPETRMTTRSEGSSGKATVTGAAVGSLRSGGGSSRAGGMPSGCSSAGGGSSFSRSMQVPNRKRHSHSKVSAPTSHHMLSVSQNRNSASNINPKSDSFMHPPE